MELGRLLLQTKNLTEKYYDLPTDALAECYGEDKWSVRKILVHLADAEAILNERIKRVIAEPKQVIWAFNQDLFCKNLDYENFPLHLSKALFIANRNAIIYFAEKYYEVLGANQFIHSETGLRTLKDEFEKVVTHNQNHLKQIEIALAT